MKGKRIDFAAVWAYNSDSKKIGVSLRGPGEGVDLNVLAKTIVGEGKSGGGGHAKASGLTISIL